MDDDARTVYVLTTAGSLHVKENETPQRWKDPMAVVLHAIRWLVFSQGLNGRAPPTRDEIEESIRFSIESDGDTLAPSIADNLRVALRSTRTLLADAVKEGLVAAMAKR